jgi:hypothetical protein
VRVVAPPGLLASFAGVARCPEPQAAQGGCAPSSEIGEASIAAGPGEDPVWIKGKIFLTGPTPPQPTPPPGPNQPGAPFGLSIVAPAVAGPFDLGEIVVRARIEVDPHTAQLTISSDPLPSILKGIPLDIRTVNMTIDRAGFTFNPTSCAPLAVTGTLTSAGGAGMAVSNPFAAVNCAKLPFKPKLSALTHARTSRADGAYLHIKIVSGPTLPGQANIAKLKLDLPKQLPARLKTLQQACAAAAFEANPADCPAASNVGTATVVTPVLPGVGGGQLNGSAYLVSRGGAAFPDLEIVLKGEGITLILDGQTSIKRGIASSAFKALPDVPISTFDLVLDDDPHSLLGTNLPAGARGSTCRQNLAIGTAITGQNGAVLKQSTKIAASGCSGAKRAKPKHPKPKRSKGKPVRGQA